MKHGDAGKVNRRTDNKHADLINTQRERGEEEGRGNTWVAQLDNSKCRINS